MTVPATLSSVPATAPYIQYVAAGGQTVYPYPFPITLDSDLVVVINGVTLATDAGYTVSGQGNPTGGNMTLVVGSTVGDIVTLYRNIAIQRITQIGQNSGFSSTAFNAEYNQIYLILQQLQESFAFTLQIPSTNSPAPVTTLAKAAYANKYLSFDANGNPTPAVLTVNGTVTQASITSLLYPSLAWETGVTNTGYPYGDVRRFGVDTTGVLSAVAGLNNAILSANASGSYGLVFLPSGNYKLDGTVNLKSNVALVGTGTTTVLTFSVLNSGAAIDINGQSQWRIESLRITGVNGATSALSTLYLIFFHNGSSNGRITKCVFDTAYLGVAGDSANAVASSAVEISNCQLNNMGLNGIGINSLGADYRVINNVLYNCGTIATGGTVGAGMELRGITRSICQGNVIRDCNYGGAGAVDGIRLEYMTENGGQQPSGVVVEGNTIQNISGYGIRGIYNLYCTIVGNTIKGSATNADGIIMAGNNATAKASNYNTITGNVITGMQGAAGINITGDTTQFVVGNSVTGNVCQGCQYGILVANANDNLFTGNVLNANTAQGLYQFSGVGNVFNGNKSYSNAAAGMQLAGGTNCSVTNNESHTNASYGIVDQATSTVLAFNNCYANTTAAYLLAGTTPKPDFTNLLTTAPTTGWGVPTNNSIINNFPGNTASVAQCGAVISELLLLLKANGYIAT